MDYSTVLTKYYSGKSWKMEDASDYDTLEWYDETPKPSKDDLDAKITELTNAEPMRILRIERDKRIAKTDWRASVDLTLSNDWKAYRQDLRDLPAQQTPKLLPNGQLDPSSISWPPEPSS